MPARRIALFVLASSILGVAGALPNVAAANHCSPFFDVDIGPTMLDPDGQVQQASGDCTGNSGCDHYFDISLLAGETLSVQTRSSAGFTPEYSVWSNSPSFNVSRACGFSLNFVAPFADTFRVRVGGFGSSNGSYTFDYRAPAGSTIVGAIPICFAVDAMNDLVEVINDGSVADLDVLRNDECKGDAPVFISPQPGDLVPDRGGSATTDGNIVLYRPAPGFVGFEEFDYTAEDAGLDGGDEPASVDQDRARVVVNVLEDLLPVAVDDAATIDQGGTAFIEVLANDFLGNEDPEVAIETPPANGTATVEADHTIRYRPNFTFFGEDSFEYRLIDANGDVSVALVTIGVFFTGGTVQIDIMPNDSGNNLNLKGGPGSGFTVAILSVGAFFDAPAQVDPLSLKLGPRQANIFGNPSVRDVDRDGDDDLLVKFLTGQTGIACGDTHANLSGRTFESRFISGQDAVNTFACPRVRKRH